MKKIFGGLSVWLIVFTTFADINDLAKSDNGFAFDLLQQIEKAQPAQNLFLSPYSVSTALQMLGNGAAAQTRTEMQEMLKTKDFSPEDLNASCLKLNHLLLSQPDVTLDLANSIWFEQGLDLKPDFVATSKRFFEAVLAKVDFEKPESADIINNWAEKKTRGKITDVVSFPFSPLTKVVLVNAIYFKGRWATPFNTNATRLRDFHLPDGTTKQTPMMLQVRNFSYQEGDGFQAVKLPYAGGRLEMMLFLPAANSSPDKLLAGFSGTNWNDVILPRFSDREGTVVFPKFKLNYDVTLNDPLKAMGMKRAFEPDAADFSALANQPLFVSLVKQKSFVDVDEEGTEAAAVTTITLGRAAMIMSPLPPFQMIVDRPFIFVISDRTTGVILFTGIVNDPAGQ
jgi:serpin B